MATTKQYASPDAYEAKLARVMERMGADQYNYNWDRDMAWRLQLLLSRRSSRQRSLIGTDKKRHRWPES